MFHRDSFPRNSNELLFPLADGFLHSVRYDSQDRITRIQIDTADKPVVVDITYPAEPSLVSVVESTEYLVASAAFSSQRPVVKVSLLF